MITENGIVTDADDSLAWVKTIRSGACESCASQDSCNSSPNGKKHMVVMLKNTLNVKPGDYVVIGMKTKPLLAVSFLIYLFPILFLIAGAFLGSRAAAFFELNPSLASLLTGGFFFGTAFLIIRKKGRTLSANEAYQSFLVRKKHLR